MRVRVCVRVCVCVFVCVCVCVRCLLYMSGCGGATLCGVMGGRLRLKKKKTYYDLVVPEYLSESSHESVDITP